MKIHEEGISYIEKEFGNLKPGDDMTIILTETRNKEKVDIEITNVRPTTKAKLVQDVKELSNMIHHGKLVIKINENGCPEINVINRERFNKNGKVKEENK
jgi:hypothetical protein